MKIGLGIGITNNRRASAPAFDPDAADYISRVEDADLQPLEPAVATVYDTFFKGLKADGVFAAINAACILAGARTLNGAFVPLKPSPMPTPSNVGFVPADYDRKTGLVGDGASKYLNSNRSNAADPQNSKHVAVYLDNITDRSNVWIGAGAYEDDGQTNLFNEDATSARAFVNSVGFLGNTFIPAPGFIGANRPSSSFYEYRVSGTTVAFSKASDPPFNLNLFVFARNGNGSALFHADTRKSFYSIGEAIDLALLDARVSQLMTDLDGAIA